MKSQSIFTLIILFISLFSFAEKGKETVEIKVGGVCEMCKKRIEDAAYSVKGVRYATWDVDTKILKVTFSDNKTSQPEIEQAIANVGHDTENVTSPDSVYSKIHNCCKYRDMETH